MKIAINTRFLIKNRLEGVGRYTYEVCKRMVLSHPDDQFIFIFDRPYDDSFIFADNVKPIVVGPPARHPVLWFWWFETAVKKVLQTEKADVFLSPDGFLSLSTKVPTVLVCHDLAYRHYPEQLKALTLQFSKKFIPQYHERADKIITVSNYSKQDIIKQFGVDSNKIRVAYNSTNKAFKPISHAKKHDVKQKYSGGNPYFIYLGSINPRKNIINLIKAFEQFKDETQSNYKLILVGQRGWKTRRIDKAYQQSKYKIDIKFLGHIEDDLGDILAAATALCYVSYFEGFGIPIIEAMQCEVPVITSDVSSMPEVAGGAAIYAQPHKAETICAAMVKIHQNPKLREQLIEKGLERLKLFDWDKTAEIIYEEISKLEVVHKSESSTEDQ